MNKLPTTLLPSPLTNLLEAPSPGPLLSTTSEPRPGDLCPRCQEQHLDYDGMLNLACPKCGSISGGCFT